MGRPSKFEPAFKAKVAVEALLEKEPLSALAKKYGVAPSVITSWKEELLQNSTKAFQTVYNCRLGTTLEEEQHPNLHGWQRSLQRPHLD